MKKNKQRGLPLSACWISGLLLLATCAMMSISGCRVKTTDSTEEADAETSGVLVVKSGQDFDSMVLGSERPVLVDFWAVWCPPCRAMEPIIKNTAGRLRGKVDVAKVNVDDNKALAGQFNIRAIPTFMIFHKGKAIAMYEGAMRQDHLDRWIEEQLIQAGFEINRPAT